MSRLELVPFTQREAAAWVREHHRHLSPVRGDVIRVGVACDGLPVGVAQAARPVARGLQDGVTLEVVRVALIEGAPKNAASMLYGAIWRAARALGWRRAVTYTREDEDGTSLRAAGWICEGLTRGGEWSRPSRPRRPAEQPIRKIRWRVGEPWAAREVEP